ncbi:uncharacterized protein LOC128041708 [Gossypium raimondii]|uniref:uncharacterized protein LOC128041708 n=1 Tax=Gossypium raimondii TaxID=29730 RepID=UPI00227D37BF|nr:uncharacterized protein LOC128041708 [Gossypium raimondii]
MYRDLHELYWWSGLRREVTDFLGKCLTCQQVRAEHQLPSGLLQPVKIPLWKWEYISPCKKVLRFARKGKLSPRFIRPYRVLKQVGPVAYQLELPPELDQIHDIFHVSMLRRYRSDPMHIVPVEVIKVRPDLTFEEEPVQILERDVNVLRRKSIPLVKVLWRNHSTEEATWEPKDAMHQQYPHLF